MNLNVILSIKPQYVREIVSGNKKFEYRKRIFKKNVDKIYIYSTSPVKKIIGYFQYSGYYKDTPKYIWGTTQNKSGIDKQAFDQYFDTSTYAYAIKIDEVHIFDTPIDPKLKFEKFIAPQSYVYIERDI